MSPSPRPINLAYPNNTSEDLTLIVVKCNHSHLIFSREVLQLASNMLEFDTAQGMFIDRQPYDIREPSPFTGTTYRHVNTDYPPTVPINSSTSVFDREPPINYHLNPPVYNPHLPGYHLNDEKKTPLEMYLDNLDREREKKEEAEHRELMNPFIESAKPVREVGNETVFQGSGHGHFSHVRGEGFHATTNVPGFGKEEGLPGGLRIKDWP